jgi:hypothetical protein
MRGPGASRRRTARRDCCRRLTSARLRRGSESLTGSCVAGEDGSLSGGRGRRDGKRAAVSAGAIKDRQLRPRACSGAQHEEVGAVVLGEDSQGLSVLPAGQRDTLRFGPGETGYDLAQSSRRARRHPSESASRLRRYRRPIEVSA